MTNMPMVFWYYCMERRAQIHNTVPIPLFHNQEITPHEANFGKQVDISNICNFGWYQWVYYRTPKSFLAAKECLGLVLGPIEIEGGVISQAVLTSKATILT